MHEANVPDWFIDACRKIGYMFPKAHAVAYVTMGLRIAYFKVYYPTEYYTCYLKRNIEKFDGSKMVCSLEHAKNWMEEIQNMPKEQRDKEDDTVTMLEILIEMLTRGIKLLPVDVYDSDPENFVIEADKTIRAPLTSLPGLGLSAAQNLAKAREDGPFTSEEDMIRRKVSKSVVDMLRSVNGLRGMPQSSQVSIFDMF